LWGYPLLTIGSGGSLSAAHLAATLHESSTQNPASVCTPLEFLTGSQSGTSTAILLLSAGGRNPDVLSALWQAIHVEPPWTTVICGNGGRNGRYTEALLKHIDAPNIPIETMFKRVRSTLDQLTNGGQMSWEHTSLIGDFRFQRRAAPGAERYATMALSDSLYPRSATAAGRLIEALKSYDWYTQNPAFHSFSEGDAAASSDDELFIVGRNIYQAACGSANEATAYISQFKQRTATLAKEQRKAILDGMLYEIFFNSLGEHRARPKLEAFSSVFRMVTDDDVVESFVFIRNSLEPYATRYHVLPGSREVVDVTISGDPTTRAGEYVVNGIWLGSTNVLREIEDEESLPYIAPGMMLASFREFLSEQLVVPVELLKVTPTFKYTGGTWFKFPSTHTVVTSQT
jgi:hypothetical protein